MAAFTGSCCAFRIWLPINPSAIPTAMVNVSIHLMCVIAGSFAVITEVEELSRKPNRGPPLPLRAGRLTEGRREYDHSLEDCQRASCPYCVRTTGAPLRIVRS